jgi:hypothetical protein
MKVKLKAKDEMRLRINEDIIAKMYPVFIGKDNMTEDQDIIVDKSNIEITSINNIYGALSRRNVIFSIRSKPIVVFFNNYEEQTIEETNMPGVEIYDVIIEEEPEMFSTNVRLKVKESENYKYIVSSMTGSIQSFVSSLLTFEEKNELAYRFIEYYYSKFMLKIYKTLNDYFNYKHKSDIFINQKIREAIESSQLNQLEKQYVIDIMNDPVSLGLLFLMTLLNMFDTSGKYVHPWVKGDRVLLFKFKKDFNIDEKDIKISFYK